MQKIKQLIGMVSLQKQLQVFEPYINGNDLTNCQQNLKNVLKDLRRSHSVDHANLLDEQL